MLDFSKINNAEYLTKQIYFLDFSSTRNNMKNIMRKFEFLQSYSFLNEKNYVNYLHNDRSTYVDGLSLFAQNDLEASKKDALKFLKIERLRFVQYPLTKYLEHEFYIYKIINKNGRKTRFFDDKSLLIKNAKDFICFDDDLCYILDFSETDLLGALKVTDKSIIAEIIEWYDCVMEKSLPCSEYMDPDISIEASLKKDGWI